MTFELRQLWFPSGWFRLFSAIVCLIALLIPNALAQSPGKFVPTGNLNAPRIGHTATLLHDGRVLIAGGSRVDETPINSAELYDPTAGTFSPSANMIISRDGHTATLLLDGRVLITGGYTVGDFGASAELYDPATGAFTLTGSMRTPHVFHAATLLNTGKVLISGADDRSLELYDPATGAFTPTGYVNGSAYGVPATRLLNGNVLLGGYHYGPDAALYDTASGSIRAFRFPDLVHVFGYSATLLTNGKILLAGGADPFTSTCCAHLYDPASETFQTTGSLVAGRAAHTATLLPSGLVLLAGGYGGIPADVQSDLASAELYDPSSGTFASTGAMTRPRSWHTATLLRDGRVLIVGGELATSYDSGPESTAELYVPAVFPTSNCGKYPTVEGLCRRIGILPWYAAIPGQWETDLELRTGTSDTLRFGYQTSLSTSPYYDGVSHNLVIDDGAARVISDRFNGIKVKSGDSYSARVLAEANCASGCPERASLGSLVVTVDGPNAAALDAAYVRATHKLLASDGSAAGQADAPVIFRDQASSRWVALVADTPLSRQEQSGATITSFAVANLSTEAQAVSVKVFNTSGVLVGSVTTPVLYGASSLGFPFEQADGVGGVYAVTLSGLLGIDLAPGVGDTVFHGAIIFEGTAGGKIAPLVVQMNWPSITSIPAKPE
jgi:hypothetical protein